MYLNFTNCIYEYKIFSYFTIHTINLNQVYSVVTRCNKQHKILPCKDWIAMEPSNFNSRINVICQLLQYRYFRQWENNLKYNWPHTRHEKALLTKRNIKNCGGENKGLGYN